MNDSDFMGKGIQFPFQLTTDAAPNILAVSESEESIRNSIVLILSTSPGERLMRSDFGCNLRPFAFERNTTSMRTRIAHEAEKALSKFEPRITVDSIEINSNQDEPNILYLDINYTVRTNNTRYNMVFPFYLEKE